MNDPLRAADEWEADQTKAIEEVTWRSRIKPVSADWYSAAPPARRWLLRDARRPNLEGLLPRGKAAQLIAEGGAGKTMALIQLAVAVATGEDWLGSFRPWEPGRVFLGLGEEEEEEARRRIYRATRTGRTPPDGSIVVLPLSGVECALLERDENRGTKPTAFLGQLRDYLVSSGPWDLIVLEPLSRFAGPDAETDNAAATRFVQTVESIVEATGATTMVAHHTNKMSRGGGPVTGAAGRGSTALFDGFRWQASLAKGEGVNKGLVTLAFTKSNYSREADDLILRRDDSGVLHRVGGAELEQIASVMDGSAARAEKVAQREEEREALQRQREERDAAKRAQRDQQKAAQTATERKLEERALVKILRKKGGITTDDLRGALAAALDGCTRDRMRNIIARLGDAVVTYWPEGCPINTRAFKLDESKLPEGF